MVANFKYLNKTPFSMIWTFIVPYIQCFFLNFRNTNKIVNTEILITSIIIYIIASNFYQTTNSLCFVFMAFYYTQRLVFV